LLCSQARTKLLYPQNFPKRSGGACLVSGLSVGSLLAFQPGYSLTDRASPRHNDFLREAGFGQLLGVQGVRVVRQLGDAEAIVLHEVVIVVLACSSKVAEVSPDPGFRVRSLRCALAQGAELLNANFIASKYTRAVVV